VSWLLERLLRGRRGLRAEEAEVGRLLREARRRMRAFGRSGNPPLARLRQLLSRGESLVELAGER